MKVQLEDTTLITICDSIRSQNGESTTYYPNQIAPAITALIWQGTQEEYDDIEVKNPSTLYIIVEEE